MAREAIDFHFVPEKQVAMHGRLENWARSIFSSAGDNASPMFRLCRTTDQYHPPHASIPYDAHDALAIARGVRDLPTEHCRAIGWYYCKPGNPTKAARDIGCTLAALAQLAIDARAMLINRRV